MPTPKRPLNWVNTLLAASSVMAILLCVLGGHTAWNAAETSDEIVRESQVLQHVRGVLEAMKDAETGQRGFLITGDEKYAERFHIGLNRNLEAMIEKGEFRSDLFYRLNVYTIGLPPLRERGDDIELLAEHFCRIFAKELGKEITGIAAETIEILKTCSWPGNVRELQSVIKHSLLESTGPVLVPAFLPESVHRPKRSHDLRESDVLDVSHNIHSLDELVAPIMGLPRPSHASTNWPDFVTERLEAGSQTVYDDAQQLMERHIIPMILQYANGNQQQAAKLLGISRATLRTKCRQHGITVDKVVDGGDI